MSFIEEIRKTTKATKERLRTRGTKKIIKETKKQIQRAAKEGQYEAIYDVPVGLLVGLLSYKSNIEHYFTKEGFTCFVERNCCEYVVRVSWKEEE